MNTHRSARTNQFSRALLVRRVREEGQAVAVAADQAGISVRTAYKWLARARQEGNAGLADRSSRPFRMPHRTPRELEPVIRELRAYRKTGAQIAVALGLPRTTVANVLKRLGLSHLPPVEPRPKVVRYEWPEPGDMVHLDVKRLARFSRPGHRVTGDRSSESRGAGWEFVFVCVDDASRVAYVEVLPKERGPIAAGFLRRAAESRALHPNHAAGVGLRSELPKLSAPSRGPPGLAQVLQSPPGPRQPGLDADRSATEGRVNNLLGMHN